MSEYIVMKLDVGEKPDITSTLESMNIPYEVHDTAVNLKGYYNNETAEIVVRSDKVEGCSHDVGFKFNAESQKYEMVVYDYDKRSNLVRAFSQASSLRQIQKIADRHMRSCEIIEGELSNGSSKTRTIKLKIS